MTLKHGFGYEKITRLCENQHYKRVETHTHSDITGDICHLSFLWKNPKITGARVVCAFASGDLSYQWR
jgi:hypothetical protein